MVQESERTITYTLKEDDIPEPLRREALRRGVPIATLAKEGLLLVAQRIVDAAEKERAGTAEKDRS